MLIQNKNISAWEIWMDPNGWGKVSVAVSREYSREICVPYNGGTFCNVLCTILFNKDYAIYI